MSDTISSSIPGRLLKWFLQGEIISYREKKKKTSTLQLFEKFINNI